MIIVMITGIFIINRIKMRFIVVSAICLPAIGGAIGLLYVPRTNRAGLMASYYTMACYGGLRELLSRDPWAIPPLLGHRNADLFS